MQKESKDCYETRGDNRFGVEQVPREWVLGVVTEIYRKEKHILVTDWRYRLYVKLWCGGYPVRYLLHRGRSAVKKWIKP